MDLWHGPVSEFVRHAASGSLPGEMTGRFVNLHGCLPNEGELRSWGNSLPALADAVLPLARLDLGVAIGAAWDRPAPALGEGSVRETGDARSGVALEYHLPLTGRRVDALFTGHDERKQPWAVVVELKQWSRVELEDAHATNVLVDGCEHVHPSEQARDYASWLSEYHSAFTTGGMRATSAAYCHNLERRDETTLRDARFGDLLGSSPLFIRGEEGNLADLVASRVGGGGGVRLLDKLIGAAFQPSKRVLDSLEAVLESREEWHLLDEQRLAFNAILAEVARPGRGGRASIIVRGAPGTGKTVIAIQLLAAALRKGWKAAHSTGGKAFTTALRSKFSGADGLFIWNMNTRNAPPQGRNAPPQGLDLLLVDEAHRVRETSDLRWTPKAERGRKSQSAELLDAAKVTVFLLDDNQSVRPDEVGSSAVLREEVKKRGGRLKEFDLVVQFRCGGCIEYVAWVDWLLGFRDARPAPWGRMYRVGIVGTPEELESLIPEARAEKQTARIVAGFCWDWSDAPATGALVPDVVIADWARPWNEKALQKQYKPASHPYTRWAETETGEGQIGCIYSAQGFDFGRIGVIWGLDLVWRKDRWVAQPQHSFDRPVKASKEMLTLVRNSYRVLMTRGMREVRLLILDAETREHVEGSLKGLQ